MSRQKSKRKRENRRKKLKRGGGKRVFAREGRGARG